jgi:hypothetical protein
VVLVKGCMISHVFINSSEKGMKSYKESKDMGLKNVSINLDLI